jgi:RNA polymerase sigma-70 factor (ECF subfamily)
MALSDDERLGQELSRGREEAFAALYDRYAPRLYRMACALLDNRHDAEDAVQAVFVGLVRSRAALAKVKNWAGYLLTSLRHEAARLAQRTRKQTSRSIEGIDAVDRSGNGGASLGPERLEAELKRLPDEQRKVLRLKIEADLTFAEIAEILQISPNTAASRYRYALEKLRHELKEGVDE